MWKSSHVKYPLFLSDFNGAWIFCIDFRKNIKLYQNPSSGAELRYVDKWDRCMDGRIDWWMDRHDKTNSRLLQFCERAFFGKMVEYLNAKPCDKNHQYI
jgi:hypothetical protein